MSLRDLWNRLTGRAKPTDEPPDMREGRSLHDSREEYEQRVTGLKWTAPSEQEKPRE